MNRKQMLDLWNMLLQSWGQRFAEQYGTSPNEAWTAMLGHAGTEAAMHAFRTALRESPTFPPTLGDFLVWVQEYRPSTAALPSRGPRVGAATTEELRQAASDEVSRMTSYRDYERWRETHAVKGKRPAHPTADSPDWLYLQRLAWIQAAADNRRTTDQLSGVA